jgi:3-isopropylmalate dehydrogenase
MRLRIALLPGDGIGPEVTAAAERVLRAVADRFNHQLDLSTHAIGGAAVRSGGPPLPRESLQACLDADAVLLGAVGDPAFDHLPPNQRIERGLLELREGMGVYANLRPAQTWKGLEDATSFRPERTAGTDLLIVRELLGGLYFGRPRGVDDEGRSAFNTMRYSTGEVERVAEVAFELATARRGRLTSVDKANALEASQLWRQTVSAMAPRFPNVTVEHQYVDACAMMLAQDPRRYDVILTENLFGDILSDEAGAVAGSLGLLPSASLGKGPALCEPVHGSAPTLTGKDAANPLGAILSVAMMFRYAFRKEDEARAIEDAAAATLAAGVRTADLAPPGTKSARCSELTAYLLNALAGSPLGSRRS